MRDDAVLRRALPLDRGLGPAAHCNKHRIGITTPHRCGHGEATIAFQHNHFSGFVTKHLQIHLTTTPKHWMSATIVTKCKLNTEQFP